MVYLISQIFQVEDDTSWGGSSDVYNPTVQEQNYSAPARRQWQQPDFANDWFYLTKYPELSWT